LVKIVYEPLQEVVIAEVVKLESIEELARPLGFMMGSGQVVGLNWAEGIVFMFNVLSPTTDTLSEEYVFNRRMYCPSMPFAIMPEYQSSIRTQEGLNVPVINVTQYPNLKDIAVWLKEYSENINGYK